MLVAKVLFRSKLGRVDVVAKEKVCKRVGRGKHDARRAKLVDCAQQPRIVACIDAAVHFAFNALQQLLPCDVLLCVRVGVSLPALKVMHVALMAARSVADAPVRVLLKAAAIVALDALPRVRHARRLATVPAEALAAGAGHMVAPAVFLHWLGAFRARLCVGCHPVARLAVAARLALPQQPHLAGARRVRVLAALEAEHCAATALRLHKRVAVDLHRSAAPRHARADAHACVVLDVGEQHRLLEAAQVAPRRATQQLLHLVEVAHRAALVRHAPDAARLALADLRQAVLPPAVAAEPVPAVHRCAFGRGDVTAADLARKHPNVVVS
mmetsp:Transcript_39513/g.117525  ORF Transcript_39513/g.117525 Transcript_39513/m.117525 type:complete len:326 (+) Transcript_39513:280-1257(+)